MEIGDIYIYLASERDTLSSVKSRIAIHIFYYYYLFIVSKLS